MNLINSGMFTPAEIQHIKNLSAKIFVKHPSDFLQYGVSALDELTRSLKDNGRWPHELFTEFFYQVAALDYWISQNQNHSLVNVARARLSAMSSVIVRMMSIKLNPEIVQ